MFVPEQKQCKLAHHTEASIPFCTLAATSHLVPSLQSCTHPTQPVQTPKCFSRIQHPEVLWSKTALLPPVLNPKCFCTASRPWCHFLPLHTSENHSSSLLYDFLTRTSATGFLYPSEQVRMVASSIHSTEDRQHRPLAASSSASPLK